MRHTTRRRATSQRPHAARQHQSPEPPPGRPTTSQARHSRANRRAAQSIGRRKSCSGRPRLPSPPTRVPLRPAAPPAPARASAARHRCQPDPHPARLRVVTADQVAHGLDGHLRHQREVADRDELCASRSDVDDVKREPVKRHTIIKPANASIRLSTPNAISATELAAIPAPTAIPNSAMCHAFPPHASIRARRSNRARSRRSASGRRALSTSTATDPEYWRGVAVLARHWFRHRPPNVSQGDSREHRADDEDRCCEIDQPEMADRGEAPWIVGGESDRQCENGGGDGSDPSPAIAAAHTEPREEDDGEADRRDEAGDRDVKVADVVVKVRFERLYLIFVLPPLFLADPKLKEAAGEVADEEDESVADEPEPGDAHQQGAPP